MVAALVSMVTALQLTVTTPACSQTVHSVVGSCHPRYSDVLERNNCGLFTFRFVYHIYCAVDIYCDTVDMGGHQLMDMDTDMCTDADTVKHKTR